MKRNSLKCAHCGSQDLEVEESIIPSGIRICCNSCGSVTPLIIYSEAAYTSITSIGNLLCINGKHAAQLYDDSHCKNLTYRDLVDAHKLDCQELRGNER